MYKYVASIVLKSTPKQLAECVDLLLQLNEPAEELCEEFLSQWVHVHVHCFVTTRVKEHAISKAYFAFLAPVALLLV